MKWFMCLNDHGFSRYFPLLRVAVKSAPPELEPYVLLDSQDVKHFEAIANVIEKPGRPSGIIYRRCSFASLLTLHYPNRLLTALGAFLRLEVSSVCQEHFWDDQHVLYTDCDVLFTGDVSPLLSCKPFHLAAAPHVGNPVRFNSGVMVLNVAAMAKEMPIIIDHIRGYAERMEGGDFDESVLNHIFAKRWEKLPADCHWFAFRGINPSARLVHFHGPKPDEGPRADIGPPREYLRHVERLRDTDSWRHYAALWRAIRDQE